MSEKPSTFLEEARAKAAALHKSIEEGIALGGPQMRAALRASYLQARELAEMLRLNAEATGGTVRVKLMVAAAHAEALSKYGRIEQPRPALDEAQSVALRISEGVAHERTHGAAEVMDNYVAVAFDSDRYAIEGLHALWRLDYRGDITVHGAAVIRRDDAGRVQVATKHTDPELRTAIESSISTLLGALARPLGALGVSGSGFVMEAGRSAVLAHVSEDRTMPIDAAMKEFGGSIFRRDKHSMRHDALWADDYDALCPYDDDPSFAKPLA